MNIEDCEVGMKVIRRKRGKTRALKEGGKYTIKRIYKNSIWIKENPGVKYLPKYFEPVNKFEVGDEVIYNCSNGIKYDSVIFGIKDRQYAIKYTHKTIEHYDVVKERQLSPLKKKDELEVGDKFRQKGKAEHKIVGVHYDEEEDSKIYVVRLLDGEIKGAIDLVFPKTIREIIYD